MKSPVGTHELTGGAQLHVYAAQDDRYRLEITRGEESVTYDCGHSARQVHAILALLS
ncbi:hypothetical protein OG455_38960 [Kitasatospora sp. NBC_01287]|uniref:hypothetical protein n=1 Tax=Kitasatospora sp. NBC_01287 TaxID=2903573 RepID=UPI00224F454E|nr:hypothetical protein [Kitasatospora sp. NBC_01287]MCX4751416.1 hypothetical protein [Kitasatospora sp. NBC_01287]